MSDYATRADTIEAMCNEYVKDYGFEELINQVPTLAKLYKDRPKEYEELFKQVSDEINNLESEMFAFESSLRAIKALFRR